MTEQEEKLMSIDYLLDIIYNLLGNDKDKYDLIIFDEINIEAYARYQNELKVAYEKGLKDGLMSDERFPF